MRPYHFETRQNTAARRPFGFTLTELLVVITIIAILASLITGAALAALRRAQEARITLEINEMSQAVEHFKDLYGAYPPNGMIYDASGTTVGVDVKNGNPLDSVVEADFIRMFKKAFPNHREPEEMIRAIAGLSGNDARGNRKLLEGGMSGPEALYFWMGGFSNDPRYPISGPGGPGFNPTIGERVEERNRRFEFDLGRLGPRDNTGAFVGRYFNYEVPFLDGNPALSPNERRQINFWTYAPTNSQQPYVYFDASRHDPDEYDLPVPVGATDTSQATAWVYGIKKLREGFSTSATPTVSDIVFVNKDRFQILHCGIDDAWGNFGVFEISAIMNNDGLLYPTGPFIGDLSDTLANFATGNFESEQE